MVFLLYGVESGNSCGVCNTHGLIMALPPAQLNLNAVSACAFLRWIKL